MSDTPLAWPHKRSLLVSLIYFVGVLAIAIGLGGMVIVWWIRVAPFGLENLFSLGLAFFLPGLIFGAYGAIVGLVFLGFGKIIDLLHQIRDTLQRREG
jgi:amino acid transporter